MKTLLRLAVCLALPQLVGTLSALATVRGVREWYVDLTRPPLTPPSWVFGPVWTLLYLGMGIAAFLVWQRGLDRPGVRLALGLFLLQLLLNGLWSLLFFGMRAPGLALGEIALLWAMILATIIAFAAVHRAAVALLVPYLVWVSFAAYLNYGFWSLNS